jgi:hypothetical protein
MTQCAEEVLKRWPAIPHHVLCTGDMGFGARGLTTSRSGCRAERLSRDLVLLGLRRFPTRRTDARWGQGRQGQSLRPRSTVTPLSAALIAVIENTRMRTAAQTGPWKSAAEAGGWSGEDRIEIMRILLDH